MSCSSPLYAYPTTEFTALGKRKYTFKRNGGEVLHGRATALPCGRCVECRLTRAYQAGIRCMHESLMHRENCFLTLTYDNEHLPPYGTLVLRDLQLFFKKLRKYFDKYDGALVRHFSCGEYGSQTKRPHYHVCLFGGNFPDRKLYGKSGLGHDLYVSQILDLIWGMGQCKIGEFNFETACYTARYVVDKVDGDRREAGHYWVFDGDGVGAERLPEFSVSSNKPGIGASYYAKFGHEIRRHDSVVINGRSVPPPRYYDKLFERLDPVGYAAMKRERDPIKSRADLERAVDEAGFTKANAKMTIVRAGLSTKKRNL